MLGRRRRDRAVRTEPIIPVKFFPETLYGYFGSVRLPFLVRLWRNFQLLFENLLKKLEFVLSLCSIKIVDLMETGNIASFSRQLPLLSGDMDHVVSKGSVILTSGVLILR